MIENWSNFFHDMHTWWGLWSHFNKHRTCTHIFLSNILYLPKITAADFCGGGHLQYSSVWSPSSSSLMTEVMNPLPLAPESNAVWSQRFGSLLTSQRMPNPRHQHKMTFHSSGKCPLLRLIPNLCNSLNKEVAIFPRWWMDSVWPRSLDLWLLSLFRMKTVRLTAHNCWPPYERRDIRPLKIMAGLLRVTDNLLLAALVPEQFDSADFCAHLEMLLIKTSASANCELCAEPQRLPGLHLWGPLIPKNWSSWTEGGNSISF